MSSHPKVPMTINTFFDGFLHHRVWFWLPFWALWDLSCAAIRKIRTGHAFPHAH